MGLAAVVSGAATGDAVVDLLTIARHLWRLKWAIIAGSLLFPAAAWTLSWVLPREYEATSVVRIISAQSVRVEPYEQFAKSDAIMQRLISHLRARKLIEDESSLGQRSVMLGISREIPSGYLPALSLSVKARSPHLARDAANAWAAVIVEEQAKQATSVLTLRSDLDGTRPEAASALEAAERQLFEARQKNAKDLMLARQRHDVTAMRAELVQRHTRIIALEEELLQARDRTPVSPGTQVTNSQSRETALARLLEHTRSEASRLGRQLDSAEVTLLNLERQHNLHERQLERVASEAADRYRRLAEHSNALQPWVTLELGSRAVLPPGPRERSRRAAIVAIPFGICVSFGIAFLAALANERRSGRT